LSVRRTAGVSLSRASAAVVVGYRRCSRYSIVCLEAAAANAKRVLPTEIGRGVGAPASVDIEHFMNQDVDTLRKPNKVAHSVSEVTQVLNTCSEVPTG
jgi:hypothetical protein